MDIAQLKADPALVGEGVWKVYQNEGEPNEVAFKIGYFRDAKYENRYNRLLMSARRKTRARDLPVEFATEALIKAMVGHIVKDWRGLTKGDQPFEYSDENCQEFLTAVPEVREWLMAESSILENFQVIHDDDNTEEPADTRALKSSPALASGVE